MNKYTFLVIIIIFGLSLPIILRFFNISLPFFEGFSNYSLNQAFGGYPSAQTKVLVQDTYPAIGKNQISNLGASDIWQEYPVFQLGSYDQITNNIRYPDNPDEGTCMPASMCGALYKKKRTGDNYVKPLPPVNPESGTRVGYFSTGEQLTDSLPFRYTF